MSLLGQLTALSTRLLRSLILSIVQYEWYEPFEAADMVASSSALVEGVRGSGVVWCGVVWCVWCVGGWGVRVMGTVGGGV